MKLSRSICTLHNTIPGNAVYAGRFQSAMNDEAMIDTVPFMTEQQQGLSNHDQSEFLEEGTMKVR